MDAFQITAARPRAKCWCGADAAITRQGEGIESHYCIPHWMLWWENALIRPTTYPQKNKAAKPQRPILVISEQVV